MDVIKALPLGPAFKPDNLCFGNNGAGNNWAKGHYTEGAELVESVLDRVRLEIEQCDAPQGFQIFHSLGGGTGSGMGTLLLLKIRDAYPDRITCTYSVYPSPKVSDTVVEPYNAVLSSHQLLENADETFIIDNEALYNINYNILKNNQPTYEELNSLIAQATCGITCSLRFPGKLNGDLRKLGVNLVPFPRLHFFLVSQAPLLSKKATSMTGLNIRELTTQAYSARNFFSNVRPEDGKYMAASFFFRGNLSTQVVDENMEKLNSKNADDFVEWIPNNLKSSIINTQPKTSDMSATFVANTTALKGIFQRLATQFGAMYRRKAFLHWYKGEGMDEMEFQEADKNVRDLITEYQDKQDATYEEEEEEEDEDI
jgi:tubulin beta